MKAEEKKDLDGLLSRAYAQNLQGAENFLHSRERPPRTARFETTAETRKISEGFRRPAGFPALILQGAAVVTLILFSFSGVTQEKFHNSPLSLKISQLAGDEEIRGWIKNDLPREWNRLIRSFGEEERNE